MLVGSGTIIVVIVQPSRAAADVALDGGCAAAVGAVDVLVPGIPAGAATDGEVDYAEASAFRATSHSRSLLSVLFKVGTAAVPAGFAVPQGAVAVARLIEPAVRTFFHSEPPSCLTCARTLR